MVLIETYWNVNFNGAWEKDPVKVVLIETYWNVNFTRSASRSCRVLVLIETYWNVNPFRWGVFRVADSSLNRNILECKFRPVRAVRATRPVLIETYWNVNKVYVESFSGECES